MLLTAVCVLGIAAAQAAATPTPSPTPAARSPWSAFATDADREAARRAPKAVATPTPSQGSGAPAAPTSTAEPVPAQGPTSPWSNPSSGAVSGSAKGKPVASPSAQKEGGIDFRVFGGLDWFLPDEKFGDLALEAETRTAYSRQIAASSGVAYSGGYEVPERTRTGGIELGFRVAGSVALLVGGDYFKVERDSELNIGPYRYGMIVGGKAMGPTAGLRVGAGPLYLAATAGYYLVSVSQDLTSSTSSSSGLTSIGLMEGKARKFGGTGVIGIRIPISGGVGLLVEGRGRLLKVDRWRSASVNGASPRSSAGLITADYTGSFRYPPVTGPIRVTAPYTMVDVTRFAGYRNARTTVVDLSSVGARVGLSIRF